MSNAQKGRGTFALVQAGLGACAVYMGVLISPPWYGCLGLMVLGVAAIAAGAAPSKCAGLWKFAWVGTVLAGAGVRAAINYAGADGFDALLAGQVALLVFITANQPGAGKTKSYWNLIGVAWGFTGTAILLVIAYRDNRPGQFFPGLAAGVFLLVLCRIWFRLGAIGIQVVNTLILLLVLLPAADLVVRFKSWHDMNWDASRYYSYEAAKKNPGGYVLWTRYYEEQWNKMMDQVMMRDPDGFMSFRFRPGTRGFLFHSSIVINRKGFRGPEIPDEKGNAFRIVALGESTTFGCTLNAGDRAWPELLEDMIRERIHPARPVQVINAGVPGATLPGNLRRLTKEILALKPDMIISYHGFNGFKMLDQDLPAIIAEPPPGYDRRPLRLLGDLEYGLKMNRYKKTLIPKPISDRPSSIRPMESDYAKAYEKLIQITQTNGIRLVLANYSMAVTTNSDPALIQFYVQTVPAALKALRANLAHSEIVQELAKEHPEICFVDTHPNFDGRHEYFIDLIHFTQGGRQHMAETFFAGIRTTLEADLAKGGGGKAE